MPEVTVSLGATVTKDYNSVRIDISVKDNTREGESVDDCTERIYKYVEQKVSSKMNEEKKALLG